CFGAPKTSTSRLLSRANLACFQEPIRLVSALQRPQPQGFCQEPIWLAFKSQSGLFRRSKDLNLKASVKSQSGLLSRANQACFGAPKTSTSRLLSRANLACFQEPIRLV